MKRGLTLIALLAAVLTPQIALASTFASGRSYDLAPGDAVQDNLYVASGTVSLGGSVQGDVFAAGGNVTDTGAAAQDLAAAGGAVTLLGPVAGDIRAAAGTLAVGNVIGGELLAAGGTVTVLPDASIGGDATFAAGRVEAKGTFHRNVVVYARDARIDGMVDGDVHAVAATLTLGPSAVIKGSLFLEGPQKAVLEDGAMVEGRNVYAYREMKDVSAGSRAALPREMIGRAAFKAFLAVGLLKLVALLVTSVLATLWFTHRSRKVVERTMGHFGEDLLTGFLTVIAAPIVLVLLFASVVGWYCFLILGAILALAGLLGAVCAPVSLGAWVRKLAAKRQPYVADWKSAALGTLLFGVAMLVPFIGWLFVAAFCMASFGTILRTAFDEVIVKR